MHKIIPASDPLLDPPPVRPRRIASRPAASWPPGAAARAPSGVLASSPSRSSSSSSSSSSSTSSFSARTE
eukprot:86328-Pyramimonas_sp.AAC.1